MRDEDNHNWEKLWSNDQSEPMQIRFNKENTVKKIFGSFSFEMCKFMPEVELMKMIVSDQDNLLELLKCKKLKKLTLHNLNFQKNSENVRALIQQHPSIKELRIIFGFVEEYDLEVQREVLKSLFVLSKEKNILFHGSIYAAWNAYSDNDPENKPKIEVKFILFYFYFLF